MSEAINNFGSNHTRQRVAPQYGGDEYESDEQTPFVGVWMRWMNRWLCPSVSRAHNEIGD